MSPVRPEPMLAHNFAAAFGVRGVFAPLFEKGMCPDKKSRSQSDAGTPSHSKAIAKSLQPAGTILALSAVSV